MSLWSILLLAWLAPGALVGLALLWTALLAPMITRNERRPVAIDAGAALQPVPAAEPVAQTLEVAA